MSPAASLKYGRLARTLRGVKLIVQIPCYNEAETLSRVIADIPRRIPGIGSVEVLVVDDGSTDGTAEVARRSGADHVVRHLRNRGLAGAFRTALDHSLRLGADIIVNTDADHQYPGGAIPQLVRPILDGSADVVVGDRGTDQVAHFSTQKKLLQKLGSFVVRRVSGVRIPDAVSGFRAMTRAAAMRLNIVSSFSYTIEMLIQSGHERLAVVSVPVATNPETRPSRLFRGVPQFLLQSSGTMLRTYTMYRPLRLFLGLGSLLLLVGSVPIARFLFFYVVGEGNGHIQSLILGGVILVCGFISLLIGLVADLIASNRALLEIVLEKLRRLESPPGAQGPPGVEP